MNVKTKVVVGGGIKKKVINPPVSDVDIIVATLGGLSKLTTLGIYKMKFVRHVVLDEADSLFDETFYDKLRHFLQRIAVGIPRVSTYEMLRLKIYFILTISRRCFFG